MAPLTIDMLEQQIARLKAEFPAPQTTYPLRVIASPHYPRRQIGHMLSYMPPITRQPRSKRLWKKLCKRRARTARPLTEPDDPVLIGGMLYCSLEHERALRDATPSGAQRFGGYP